MQTVLPKKYIEIDSTYRNRNLWPNPAEFKVPIMPQGLATSSDKALDGTSGNTLYCWAGRQDIGFLIEGVPSAPIISTLIGGESVFKGQFIDMALMGGSEESALITFYSEFSSTMYLETPLSNFAVGNSAVVKNPSTDDTILVFLRAAFFDGQFNGMFLYNLTQNEIREISDYSSKFNKLYLTEPFTNPNLEDEYCILKEKPYPTFVNKFPFPNANIVFADGGNTVFLPALSPQIPDIYKGLYITIISFTDNLPAQETRLVTGYDPLPINVINKLFVSPAFNISTFNTAPTVMYYYFTTYQDDKASGLNSYIDETKYEKLYKITLNNLTLPNLVINNSLGGTTSNYPYVYVAFYNSKTKTKSLIDSNNPNAGIATFRCPITDVNNYEISTFIKIQSEMVSTFLFNPNDDIYFAVYMPDGRLFESIAQDTPPNIEPDPLLQISACFAFEEI